MAYDPQFRINPMVLSSWVGANAERSIPENYRFFENGGGFYDPAEADRLTALNNYGIYGTPFFERGGQTYMSLAPDWRNNWDASGVGTRTSITPYGASQVTDNPDNPGYMQMPVNGQTFTKSSLRDPGLYNAAFMAPLALATMGVAGIPGGGLDALSGASEFGSIGQMAGSQLQPLSTAAAGTAGAGNMSLLDQFFPNAGDLFGNDAFTSQLSNLTTQANTPMFGPQNFDLGTLGQYQVSATGDILKGVSDFAGGLKYVPLDATGLSALPDVVKKAAGQAAQSALSKAINGTATADDWMKLFGTAGSTLLGVLGSNSQGNAATDYFDKYWGAGAKFRAQAGNFLDNPQNYFGSDAGKEMMRQAAQTANLRNINDPGGQAALYQAMAPQYYNTMASLMNMGGVGLGPSADFAKQSVASSGNLYNVLGAGLNDLVNPKQDIAGEFLKLMKGGGFGGGITGP